MHSLYFHLVFNSSPSLPTSEDLPEPPSETQVDDHHHESNEEKLVAQSYARLARISLTPFTQGGGAGGEEICMFTTHSIEYIVTLLLYNTEYYAEPLYHGGTYSGGLHTAHVCPIVHHSHVCFYW